MTECSQCHRRTRERERDEIRETAFGSFIGAIASAFINNRQSTP